MQCAYLLKIRRESHLQNAVSSQQSTLTLTKRLNSIYSKLTSKYVILTNHMILDQQAAGSCVKSIKLSINTASGFVIGHSSCSLGNCHIGASVMCIHF